MNKISNIIRHCNSFIDGTEELFNVELIGEEEDLFDSFSEGVERIMPLSSKEEDFLSTHSPGSLHQSVPPHILE